jgi:hypothetical protein
MGKLRERRRKGIILKWARKKLIVKCELNLFSIGQAPVMSCREHGSEPWGSIKHWKFLVKLIN